ncbi:MAG: 2-amino-4-hydroxy-6-hydroxymethyldihydropteridine diphosphokinase [Bacteroidota bacterium]|jgi:2-amino-4-hydroxy-6-hydroxymethyldihydropteridine diphosphokinase
MNTVYLLLGSNQGDRKALFEMAKLAIETHIGSISKQSSLYESEAWGVTDQALFLNCVLAVDTLLDAESTLQQALLIEQSLGRVRHTRWTERTIDIDILYFNNDIYTSSSLSIPHPEIQNRRFTLVPLCEIAPQKIHPILQKSQEMLLHSCADVLKVWVV